MRSCNGDVLDLHNGDQWKQCDRCSCPIRGLDELRMPCDGLHQSERQLSRCTNCRKSHAGRLLADEGWAHVSFRPGGGVQARGKQDMFVLRKSIPSLLWRRSCSLKQRNHSCGSAAALRASLLIQHFRDSRLPDGQCGCRTYHQQMICQQNRVNAASAAGDLHASTDRMMLQRLRWICCTDHARPFRQHRLHLKQEL